MIVAALYDIHGNIAALDAVLADVRREGVDAVVVGGDVAWGPFPAETVERLMGLEETVRLRARQLRSRDGRGLRRRRPSRGCRR